MRVTVVGCGDAFGSGGRSATCFWVESGDVTLALDFGAGAMAAARRQGLDPSRLDLVVLSHLHGDHFGGLPFLLLDGQFNGGRERPLTIVGPLGTAERLTAALEVFFPGASGNRWRYALNVIDLPCLTAHSFGHLTIESREVVHPSGAPSTGVRIADGRRVLAYSGDTGWTEALAEVARDADLFILECYKMTGPQRFHLDLATIEAGRARLTSRRIVLTHMSEAVLAHRSEIEARGYVVADDGLVLHV